MKHISNIYIDLIKYKIWNILKYDIDVFVAQYYINIS